MRYLLLALFITGCGSAIPEQKPHSKKYDVVGFEQYVEAFRQEADDRDQKYDIKDLVISFNPLNANRGPTDPYTLGLCTLTPNETPKIDVDKDMWDLTSEDERQRLINHEMGHCILHRNHMADHLSIMRAMMLSDEEYDPHATELLDELFNKQYYGSFGLVDGPRIWVN